MSLDAEERVTHPAGRPRSASSTDLARLMGIAKPRPLKLPDVVAICSLTPMTLPSWSRSGPPELPWLIAASVWMPLGITAPFGAREVAPQAGDDAGGEGEVEAEGIADGDDPLADGDARRVAERQGREVASRRVDAQHGHVGGLVDAEDARLDLVAGLALTLPEGDGDRGRLPTVLRHDVRVGQDRALLVDHEPAAEGLAEAAVRVRRAARTVACTRTTPAALLR